MSKSSIAINWRSNYSSSSWKEQANAVLYLGRIPALVQWKTCVRRGSSDDLWVGPEPLANPPNTDSLLGGGISWMSSRSLTGRVGKGWSDTNGPLDSRCAKVLYTECLYTSKFIYHHTYCHLCIFICLWTSGESIGKKLLRYAQSNLRFFAQLAVLAFFIKLNLDLKTRPTQEERG